MKSMQKYNRELENIDSEYKAYLLGYLYGDGSIGHSKMYKRMKKPRFYVNITSKDCSHIDKILKIFPFFNLNKNQYNHCTLTKCDINLYNDLVKNGVFERKSFENKDKLNIPNLEEYLIPHFIRGLYDSDGGIYNYNGLIETFFCCASFIFIEKIRNWFLQHEIKLNIRETRKNKMYFLRSKSNKTAIKFYNLIYKDAKIFMDRKREVFNYMNSDEGCIKLAKQNALKPASEYQKKKLIKDYKNIIEKFKKITVIEKPSICCNYHTIESGFSLKRNLKRPLNLCLKCGKRSVFHSMTIKQDELLETP